MKRVQTGIKATLAALSLAFFIGYPSSNAQEPAPADASVEQAREDVRTAANNTLQTLYSRQPSAKQAVEGGAGYAVFTNTGLKIFVAGGGQGKGMAMNNKTREEIFMRMAEVQAGLGFGIKKFRLVWVFETQDAFNKFVNSGYQFGGQATLTAKAASKGGGFAGAASVSPGVWVYQLTDDGIAAELTVKGTKYYRDKKLSN